MSHVFVFETPDEVAQGACRWLSDDIQHCLNRENRPYILSLSGGSTPKRLYQLLAKLPAGDIDWSRVFLVLGDERNVPIDSRDSNYRMVKESLLDMVDIPSSNVLGFDAPEGDATNCAAGYQLKLQQLFPGSTLPSFSCVLLGLGDDAHTASLFPYTEALDATESWYVANEVPKLGAWRMTLTAPAINAARRILFLVCGPSKQSALHHVWHSAYDYRLNPSQLITARNEVTWMLDRQALGSTEIPKEFQLGRSIATGQFDL
ncbi:MAG: 6-phosphogluconolactonase [Planctomycetales bacterium]|nr:6-phosphogluconolactonase [Planctomycetales bacterium]